MAQNPFLTDDQLDQPSATSQPKSNLRLSRKPKQGRRRPLGLRGAQAPQPTQQRFTRGTQGG